MWMKLLKLVFALIVKTNSYLLQMHTIQPKAHKEQKMNIRIAVILYNVQTAHLTWTL